MKHLATITVALAAITALISATPAFAASSTSASLSNIIVTLTDLDLEDGITPLLTWLDKGYTQVDGWAYDPLKSNFPSFAQINPTDFVALNGSAATLLSQTSANTTGADFNTAGMQAHGSALGDGASYRAVAFGDGYFTLSPHTHANFSALANIQAVTTVGYDGG